MPTPDDIKRAEDARRVKRQFGTFMAGWWVAFMLVYGTWGTDQYTDPNYPHDPIGASIVMGLMVGPFTAFALVHLVREMRRDR